MPGLPVAILEPARALVLNGRMDLRTGKGFDLTGPRPESYVNSLWTWHLEETVAGATRLISRSQSHYGPGFLNWILYSPLLVEPIGSIMSRKMLLGIKRRAEAAG